jgi:GH43 family beta-xylosidase
VSHSELQSSLNLGTGQDPWLIYHENFYYLVQSINDAAIGVRKSDELEYLDSSPNQIIWTPPPDHNKEVWAPELHFVDRCWYIYYAASDGFNQNHRMYVLLSESANPQGPYRELGKISDPNHDVWAIDMTILHHQNNLYAIWSGWEKMDSFFPQNLYIAHMGNPWTIDGDRVLISQPEHPWETSIRPINEGPEILKKNGRTFIVYSADASWNCAYKLGLLELHGSNVLNPASWIKYPEPVLQGNTSVYGPGHASFLTDIRKSDWIIYHVKSSSLDGWKDRQIRAKTFTYNSSGLPSFGNP